MKQTKVTQNWALLMHATTVGRTVCEMKPISMAAIVATFAIRATGIFILTRIWLAWKECVEGKRQNFAAKEWNVKNALVAADSLVNSNKMDKEG